MGVRASFLDVRPSRDSLPLSSRPTSSRIGATLRLRYIAILQVFLGCLMLPLLPLEAFGGTPYSEIPDQLVDGFICYLPADAPPSPLCSL